MPTTASSARSIRPLAGGLVAACLWCSAFAQQPHAVTAPPAQLRAHNADASDGLGRALAIAGDTAVLGTLAESGDGNTLRSAGAAYVFVRDGAAWVQQAYLKPHNTQARDFFGRAVAISGDTIAVGADWEDGADGSDGRSDTRSDAGAVYVFTRRGTIWTQEAYLKPHGAAANDRFGAAVALAGDTLVVGAPDASADGAAKAGAAYVFTRRDGIWMQEAHLRSDTAAEDDAFGSSVAVADGVIAVGAPLVDGAPGHPGLSNAGAVFVFDVDGGAWTQAARLSSGHPAAGDFFGAAVAAGAERVVAGSRERAGAVVDGGAAYVFARSAAGWSPQARLLAPIAIAREAFGGTVALDGQRLAAGASGAAYVFEQRADGGWDAPLHVVAPDAVSATFGRNVALSGDQLLVSDTEHDGPAAAPVNNSGTGYVYALPAD